MRQLPEAFNAHIEMGATTMCRAWRLTRRDGAVLGFTEHDHALDFDGTTFEAASGFAASEARVASGLQAPAAAVEGGFSSAAITEADLAAGRYDGARVELFLVNWRAPEVQHALLALQEIGEVSRAGPGFSAELRSFAHRLQQPTGRIYNRRCDADLGDGRCRVDMTVGGRRVMALVAAVETPDRLVIAGLPDLGAGHFRLGRLRFDAGILAGRTVAVEESGATEGGAASIRLWLPLEAEPVVGDPVTLSIGCDKSFAMCRERFGNGLNFQGFPHMPGSDFAYSYVSGETTHDGSVLFD
ncbi:DUF2163 domain-containing protein [Rhizobium sp. CECT 9324]|uniref:DUF2163 domain-containing protein n=1 Tax=Rhizobium sp. CECT 9324 TaxID=2845820 RepID=UPI001E282A41|nr:DUF2163 domain-containing protein [Rhizobium sp. CECT 9324]CAH0340059.1 hypothetical protein RHI9324_01715 [Rhizobium sp. CECT 9324]